MLFSNISKSQTDVNYSHSAQINNLKEFVDRIYVAKGYFESTNILLREIKNEEIATMGNSLIFNFKHCSELVGKPTEWVLTGSTSSLKHSSSGIVNRTRNKLVAKHPIIAGHSEMTSHQIIMTKSQRRIVEARKDLINNIRILSKEVKESDTRELDSGMQFDLEEINKLLLKYEDGSDQSNTKARYGGMTYSEKNNFINEIKKDIRTIGTVISFYEVIMWDSVIKDVSVEGTRMKINLKK